MTDLNPAGQLLHMHQKDFHLLGSYIEKHFGIKMPAVKKELLEARLSKRLRALKLGAFSDYIDYLFSPAGQTGEFLYFIDLVSTHETSFFRESAHFEILQRLLLPKLLNDGNNNLKVWSAGCSTGEEPFSLAIAIEEWFDANRSFVKRYDILGTDLSDESLRKALFGVYSEERIKTLPLNLRNKYLLRSIDPADTIVRIIPTLRAHLRFRSLNFMETRWGLAEKFHIIFCRNVLIYFSHENQRLITKKLIDALLPGGYLVRGHSETVIGFQEHLKVIEPAVYQKTA